MEPVDKYWESFFESLWSPESWFKVVFLLALLPLWGPTARAMLREIIASIRSDGNADHRPAPGEDPFWSVPLARHRDRRLPPRTGVSQGSRSGTRSLTASRNRRGFATPRR